MNLQRRLRVRYWVWLFISLLLFLLAWYLPLPPEAKGGGDMRYWEFWSMLLRGDYHCSTGEILVHLAIYSVIFAILTTLAGWILQYFVGMGWEDLTRRIGRRPPVSP
ncbi:MAG TPA: hypothetical protein VKA46_05650 [Gemmataceae bacterium]|nr:hypothetical protein [Gemmataceae bacterium]